MLRLLAAELGGLAIANFFSSNFNSICPLLSDATGKDAWFSTVSDLTSTCTLSVPAFSKDGFSDTALYVCMAELFYFGFEADSIGMTSIESVWITYRSPFAEDGGPIARFLLLLTGSSRSPSL